MNSPACPLCDQLRTAMLDGHPTVSRLFPLTDFTQFDEEDMDAAVAYTHRMNNHEIEAP